LFQKFIFIFVKNYEIFVYNIYAIQIFVYKMFNINILIININNNINNRTIIKNIPYALYVVKKKKKKNKYYFLKKKIFFL